ncbi:hypothetical protein Tco_0251022 [Tanacetum coccineum]
MVNDDVEPKEKFEYVLIWYVNMALFKKNLIGENPEGGDYPFDLTKPLPLVMSRNRQKVPVDYFFNNDLKYLQKKSRGNQGKLGYGYLKEIVVRRADNDLYRFKEGDFPRLRINDIEDMLLRVVQNRSNKSRGRRRLRTSQ